MISLKEAQRIVLENTPEAEPCTIALGEALGHVLAEEIRADADVPPFHRAAMDGYALCAASITHAPIELEVLAEIQAGPISATFAKFASKNASKFATSASRIMTGAPLPPGTDAVLEVEQTERLDAGRRVRLLARVRPGDNVAPPGHEVRAGETVLERGRRIGPAEIGVLATFGCVAVPVYRKPRVAVLATGNELVEAACAPGPGQIRNSNEPVLRAQLASLGLPVVSLGIGRDDPADLEARMRRGLAQAEVLMVTGGVSMGDYDLCKGVFERLGAVLHFQRLRMKPAKPTTFATAADRMIFGLPGNPVSAFVAFENVGRPGLLRRMGLPAEECLPRRLRLPLAADYRQRSERETFLPARLEELAEGSGEGPAVRVLQAKGSADITAFARGTCMAIFPPGEQTYAAGTPIEVQLLF